MLNHGVKQGEAISRLKGVTRGNGNGKTSSGLMLTHVMLSGGAVAGLGVGQLSEAIS